MAEPFRQWLAPRLHNGSYIGWVAEADGTAITGLHQMASASVASGAGPSWLYTKSLRRTAAQAGGFSEPPHGDGDQRGEAAWYCVYDPTCNRVWPTTL